MSPSLTVARIQAIAYLLAGLVSAGIAIGLVLNPRMFTQEHPLPLLVLLVISIVFAGWRAYVLFRTAR
jgi:hypothetical protein